MFSYLPVHIVALLALAPGLLAAATKTATIGLFAEVLPACSAGSTAANDVGQFGTFDFGTHSILSTQMDMAGQPGNGALRINCLSNTPYQVLLSAGVSGNVNARSMVGPSAQIAYNLYTSSSYQTVWDNTVGISRTGNGQDQWLPIYGRLPAQRSPASGIYRDTVTVTVKW